MLVMLLESGQGRLRLLLLHEDGIEHETPISLAQRLGHEECYEVLCDALDKTRLKHEPEKHTVGLYAIVVLLTLMRGVWLQRRRLQVAFSMRRKAWRQRNSARFDDVDMLG